MNQEPIFVITIVTLVMLVAIVVAALRFLKRKENRDSGFDIERRRTGYDERK